MGVCTFRRESTKAASNFDVLDPRNGGLPSPVTPLANRKLATKFRFCIFKIALKPSSIPAKVSNLRASSLAIQPCDYGHDFCKAKVAMPPHYGQSILLRKTVYDRPAFFGVHTCAVNESRKIFFKNYQWAIKYSILKILFEL